MTSERRKYIIDLIQQQVDSALENDFITDEEYDDCLMLMNEAWPDQAVAIVLESKEIEAEAF